MQILQTSYTDSAFSFQRCRLRPSVLGQDRSETKKIGLGLGLVRCGLGLSGLVLYPAIFVLVSQVRYCFVKNDLVTLVVVTILKDTATFQVLFIISLFSNFSVLGTSLLWRSTVRDADETFMAETETRPETFSLETETRPRHWKIPPRRDRDRDPQ